MKRRNFGLFAIALIATACSENGDLTGPGAAFEPAFSGVGPAGVVYTMTNAAAGNSILQYGRDADGALSLVGEIPTGGLGTGTGLGNQGGLTVSDGGHWLFVVNAGDNTVSVFERGPGGGLTLTDVEASGGTRPISITQHDNRVYVLNGGGAGGIAGFAFANGDLQPLAGSARPLSQAAPGPAQIEFTANGSQLVVTEKGTNRILVYNVDRSTGLASQPVVNASSGTTPFGFGFDNRGVLIVSNAVGGAAGAGSLSSYGVRSDGTLDVLDPEVPNFQGASCWVVVTNDGRFTYTTNAASNSTSGYGILPDGRLELLDAAGVSGINSGAPIDAAISVHGGNYLYVLNASAHAIDAFRIESDGALTAVAGGVGGLPAGANGLVAF